MSTRLGKNYRILQVSPFYYPEEGGISNHVHNISQQLESEGDDVLILCPRQIIRKPFPNLKGKIPVKRVPSIYMLAWPYPTLRSVSFPISGGLEIDSIMRSFKPQIVHVHGHHYPLSWLAIWQAYRRNIPSILTMHGMYALNPKSVGRTSYIEEIFNKLVFYRTVKKARAVVGLSESITSYALKYKADHVKYVTIGNGIDTELYSMNSHKKLEYRQKYGIQQDSVVVLFRGRLEDVKGIVEFSLAAKEVSARLNGKVEIVIVGEGSLDEKVKFILAETDQVHIYGWQPMDKVHELYVLSDIYVLPSKAEALPITVIEAMNALLHIVFTPVGGVPDILSKYSAKTLLQSGTPNEIAAALFKLIASGLNYPDSGSAMYARKFDWKSVVQSLRDLYASVL